MDYGSIDRIAFAPLPGLYVWRASSPRWAPRGPRLSPGSFGSSARRAAGPCAWPPFPRTPKAPLLV
eukprot:4867752-Alexandrium_andersonii.AAC.1